MAGTEIFIGTSGWSYPKGEGTWKGYFYPPGVKNELEYYSRFFNTVEVNSSFYRPPYPETSAGWAKKTPPDFIFAVKLWQKFTHPAMYRQTTGEAAAISHDDVVLFKRGIEPLERAGKLGALLVQFPPSVINDEYGRQILAAVLNAFSGYRLAIELRHRSWSDDPDTVDTLRSANACWVEIDEPKFSFSVASGVPVTADFSYFRFHGRNAAMWWKGNAETRYKYLYSKEEIGSLAEKVARRAQATSLNFAFFNNHWQAYAPKNAGDMIRALNIPFKDFFSGLALENE